VEVPEVDPEGGEAATEQLLRRPAAARPTAVVLAAEILAIGAYAAAARLGAAIPGDLSVAALGGNPEARALRPRLASARMDHEEVGLHATRLLLTAVDAAWAGRTQPTATVTLTPRFDPGDSTAPPEIFPIERVAQPVRQQTPVPRRP
jgi:LacI family transcriptional regulator